MRGDHPPHPVRRGTRDHPAATARADAGTDGSRPDLRPDDRRGLRGEGGVLLGRQSRDLPGHTSTISTVTCPFTGAELAAVAALNPDVTIVHAQRADRAGNVQLRGITGVRKEAVLAARRALATVEEIVDELTPVPGAVVLPHWVLAAVAVAPDGAAPSSAHGYYDRPARRSSECGPRRAGASRSPPTSPAPRRRPPANWRRCAACAPSDQSADTHRDRSSITAPCSGTHRSARSSSIYPYGRWWSLRSTGAVGGLHAAYASRPRFVVVSRGQGQRTGCSEADGQQ